MEATGAEDNVRIRVREISQVLHSTVQQPLAVICLCRWDGLARILYLIFDEASHARFAALQASFAQVVGLGRNHRFEKSITVARVDVRADETIVKALAWR